MSATPVETLPPQPGAPAASGTAPAPAPPPRRSRTLAAVAAALVIAVAVGGALVARDGGDGPGAASGRATEVADDGTGAEPGQAEFHEVGDAIEPGGGGAGTECWPSELEEESGDPCAGSPASSPPFTGMPATWGLAAFLPLEDDVAALGLGVDDAWELVEDTNQVGGTAGSFCVEDAPLPVELQWRRWAVPNQAEVSARVTAMASRSDAVRAVIARQAPSFPGCMQIQAMPFGRIFGDAERGSWKLGPEVTERDDRTASKIIVLTGGRADACETTVVYGWRQVGSYEIATYVQTCAGDGEPDTATVDRLLDQIQAEIESG